MSIHSHPDTNASQPRLREFRHLLKSKPEELSHTQWFANIASLVGNHLCLRAGNKRYRITEIEFYYFGEGHKDVHCHKHEKQLTSEKWYYHVSGLDITFGPPQAHGGILIRGIAELTDSGETLRDKYFSGPQLAFDELMSNLGSVFEAYWLSIEEHQIHQTYTPIPCTRIGLKSKNDDIENFSEQKLRYILDLSPSHKFKNRETVRKSMSTAGK